MLLGAWLWFDNRFEQNFKPNFTVCGVEGLQTLISQHMIGANALGIFSTAHFHNGNILSLHLFEDCETKLVWYQSVIRWIRSPSTFDSIVKKNPVGLTKTKMNAKCATFFSTLKEVQFYVIEIFFLQFYSTVITISFRLKTAIWIRWFIPLYHTCAIPHPTMLTNCL